MVAVGIGEAEIAPILADWEQAGWEPGVSIAAVNGPASVVLSGAEKAVLALADELRARGYRAKRLRIDLASHCFLVEPMLPEFGRIAGQLAYCDARIPVVSTLSGRLAEPGDLTTPGYWVRELREPVRFQSAVRAMEAGGARTFLEIGPADTLTAMTQGSLTVPAEAVPILRGGYDEPTSLLTALARLHVRGRTLVVAPPPVHVALPTYPFERKRYWLERNIVPPDTSPISVDLVPETAEEPPQSLIDQLIKRPAAQRREELVTRIIGLAAVALGHETTDDFDEETGFFDVGFSSLTAVELRNKINEIYGIKAPAMLLFDYPTPGMLADYLEELLFAPQAN